MVIKMKEGERWSFASACLLVLYAHKFSSPSPTCWSPQARGLVGGGVTRVMREESRYMNLISLLYGRAGARAALENTVAVVTAGWIGDRFTVTLPNPQIQSCNLWNRDERSRSGNVRRLLNPRLWWEEKASKTKKAKIKTLVQCLAKFPCMQGMNGFYIE